MKVYVFDNFEMMVNFGRKYNADFNPMNIYDRTGKEKYIYFRRKNSYMLPEDNWCCLRSICYDGRCKSCGYYTSEIVLMDRKTKLERLLK